MPTVWRAEPDEAEAVADLLVGFRDHMGHDWPSENAFLAGVERLIERTDTEFLLGCPDEDSPPAGVCQLRFRHGLWMAAEDCWLEDLYVAESARRTGVGTALMDAALKRARERGCRRVELDVSDANAGALALYERFGFTTGKEPGTSDLFMGVRLEEPS